MKHDNSLFYQNFLKGFGLLTLYNSKVHFLWSICTIVYLSSSLSRSRIRFLSDKLYRCMNVLAVYYMIKAAPFGCNFLQESLMSNNCLYSL